MAKGGEDMKKLICVFIAVALLFSGCSIFNKETSIERVQRLTGLDLPTDMIEEYYFLDQTFTGVAGQYSVYSVEKEPEIIKETLKDQYDTQEKVNEQTINMVQDYLVRHDIPQEYYIDFNAQYKYITGAEQTYVFYFSQTNQVKIFMFGH